MTRQLCEIESTTYNEGAVGDFLADFLAGRGWERGKDSGAAASGERDSRRALECVCGSPRAQTPDLVFSTHMDTVPPYIPFSEDDGVYVRARGFRRQGNYCRAGGRG